MIHEPSDTTPTPPPQDLVAIFHASFHPTKGNIVDWCLKSSDDLNIDNLEFSALPSGLHLVDQDIVYFTNQSHHGLCLFRRRRSSNPIHRGFRLSSLGILLAPSSRPRPWRHLPALREVADRVYSSIASEAEDDDAGESSNQVLISLDGIGASSIPREDLRWEPARQFFEERKVRRSDLGGAGDWKSWSEELDGIYSTPSASLPTLHLPHLLKILGPSSLTLYKHILGRRRVLIYTQPPVEAACILCYVAADMAWEIQFQSPDSAGASPGVAGNALSKLRPKDGEGTKVLGMITLNDLMGDKLENADGRGWVACTTDALFLEKPQYYDLLIDLTTFTSGDTMAGYRPRPTFYLSKPVTSSSPTSPPTAHPLPPTPPSSPSKPTQYRLSTTRFAWSDVRLWSEIDRILKLQSSNHLRRGPSSSTPSTCNCCSATSSATTRGSSNTMNNMSGPTKPSKPSQIITAWTDAWQVYEDVCLLCAGLWMCSWKRKNEADGIDASEGENWGLRKAFGRTSNSGGEVRLDGEDDALLDGIAADTSGRRLYMRSLGMGIEGVPLGPSTSSGSGGTTSTLGVGASGSTSKSSRRVSAMSWSSGRATVVGSTIGGVGGNGKAKQGSFSSPPSSGLGIGEESRGDIGGEADSTIDIDTSDVERQIEQERRESEVRTTLALLQTLYAYAAFQVGVLEAFLPAPEIPPSAPSRSASTPQQQQTPASVAATGVSTGGSTTPTKRTSGTDSSVPPISLSNSNSVPVQPTSSSSSSPDFIVINLTPKDLSLFDLNPLSGFDARYLEWLGAGYVSVREGSGGDGGEGQVLRVVVKRGWKELVGALVGW